MGVSRGEGEIERGGIERGREGRESENGGTLERRDMGVS